MVIPFSRGREDAIGPAIDLAAAIASILKGRPAGFEKEALLGVHQLRFSARHLEELRIKKIDVSQEAAPLAIGFVGVVGIRVIIIGYRPALRRHFGNGAMALG